MRTLDALNELKDLQVATAKLLGVLPFRDRWIGQNQTSESRLCVDAMRNEVGTELILPSIRESEQFKKAITKGTILIELGYPDLEYPFEVLASKIAGLLDKEKVHV